MVKRNQQVPSDSLDQHIVPAMIVDALMNHQRVQTIAFPKLMPQPTFSRYQTGMYYGPHLDEAIMSTRPAPTRTDLSVTVFLSNANEYDGGELEIWLGNDRSNVKLDAGDAVLYPTGLIHQIKPVTAGQRYAAVTWIQSLIPDVRHRQVLSHYYQLSGALKDKTSAEEKLLMESVRTNLFRLWADP